MNRDPLNAIEIEQFAKLFERATGCRLQLPPETRNDFVAWIGEVYLAVAPHYNAISRVGQQHAAARRVHPSLPEVLPYDPQNPRHVAATSANEILYS